MSRLLRFVLVLAVFSLLSLRTHAQISLTTAVDLSLRNSPRVKMAQAEVIKADASLAEARAVYIPSLVAGGSGYGRSYGYPQGQPSLLNVNTQSLVFNYSQRDYIRAARSGLSAADYALMDARSAVAEDTALTYLAVAHDQDRLTALEQQRALAAKLVSIIEQRLNAGQDTAISLTVARLSSAQLHLALLHTEDELASHRLHLEHLTGLPSTDLTGLSALPELPLPSSVTEAVASPVAPGIQAAFTGAQAKLETAFGDARYVYRPQVSFGAQYSRISTFNNGNYLEYFGRRDAAGNLLPFPANSFGIGVQVSIPLLDYGHRAKERASLAEANRAQREAEQIRDQFVEGRVRLQRSALELAARVEVARLDQQLAQQQLDILLLQLDSGTGNPDAPQMTPKDEQNARIAEREKFLSLLDSRFEMQQIEINLLRQTGALEQWLRTVAHAATTPSPADVSGQVTAHSR